MPGLCWPSNTRKKLRRQRKRSPHFRFLFARRGEYVQGLLHPESKEKRAKPERVIDPNVRDAQERLQRALGLKVTIEDHNGRGRVIIEYARLEDFDALLDRLAAD